MHTGKNNWSKILTQQAKIDLDTVSESLDGRVEALKAETLS